MRTRDSKEIRSLMAATAQPNVQEGIEYWNTQPASLDGVLGGYGSGVHFFSHFPAFALIDLCSSVSSTSRCSRLQTFLAPSLPPTVNSTLRVQALGCARDPTEDTRS